MVPEPTGTECTTAQDPAPACKPTAMAIAQLPDGREFYYDGFEGMNHVKLSVALEFANLAQNDQARVMDLRGSTPTWSAPKAFDEVLNTRGAQAGNDDATNTCRWCRTTTTTRTTTGTCSAAT